MGLMILIIAAILVFGAVGAAAARGPFELPDVPRPFSKEDVKKFSPQKTLFIVGPGVNHHACRMQRRLLRPAIALLIREDVTVIEIYGETPARRNGEAIDWLDPSLLRHAINAEDGFYVVYVDEDGKTAFRSTAPMVAADIFERANLPLEETVTSDANSSLALKELRTA